eukprot:332609_1
MSAANPNPNKQWKAKVRRLNLKGRKMNDKRMKDALNECITLTPPKNNTVRTILLLLRSIWNALMVLSQHLKPVVSFEIGFDRWNLAIQEAFDKEIAEEEENEYSGAMDEYCQMIGIFQNFFSTINAVQNNTMQEMQEQMDEFTKTIEQKKIENTNTLLSQHCLT